MNRVWQRKKEKRGSPEGHGMRTEREDGSRAISTMQKKTGVKSEQEAVVWR